MLKKLLIVVIILSGANYTSVAQDNIEAINHLMQEAHRRGIFNGNVLIAHQSKVIFQSEYGFADGKQTIPLQKNHRFSIGSIAKEFNAVGIMLLNERGKLSLSDPISRHLPELPFWADSIQIKHLLIYTSGLPNIQWESAENNADVWQDLLDLPHLESVPGVAYRYSNNNVFIQKRIIEKVADQNYADFVQKHLFTPCNIVDFVFDPTTKTPRLARAFDNDQVEDSVKTITTGWPSLSVGDLFRWSKGLHEYQVISKASLEKLFDHFEGRGSSLGHGHYEHGQLQLHEHHGSDNNYEAYLYVDIANEYTVVFTTNNKNFRLEALAREVGHILQNQPYAIPQKSVYLTLRTRIFNSNAAEGIQFLRFIQENQPDIYDFTDLQADINDIGYYLLRKDRIQDAIEVFRLNTEYFPDSANCYDSLGEAYHEAGDNVQALRYYGKALTLDPGNERIEKTIAQIKKQL